ncbi:MAG: hypothetical protein KA061_08460 [Bacteroidales bacterium]|nr:hypothetical protein [Bacteroidales bacterium]
MLIIGILGVLTPNEILSGFANDQIMVIILLLLIGQMIRITRMLDGLLNVLELNLKKRIFIDL